MRKSNLTVSEATRVIGQKNATEKPSIPKYQGFKTLSIRNETSCSYAYVLLLT